MKTRIQELRKDQKVTQMELAESVGVTRQTIISLENGRYKASLVLAHKIAQFFGVTIEDIFIFDQEEEKMCIRDSYTAGQCADRRRTYFAGPSDLSVQKG